MKFIETNDGYHINVEFIMGLKVLNGGPCVRFTMIDGSIINKCFTTINELQKTLDMLGQ